MFDSANEITLNANKKTIMPADVFKALEEIEFDFLKEPLEAEFASTYLDEPFLGGPCLLRILLSNLIAPKKSSTPSKQISAMHTVRKAKPPQPPSPQATTTSTWLVSTRLLSLTRQRHPC